MEASQKTQRVQVMFGRHLAVLGRLLVRRRNWLTGMAALLSITLLGVLVPPFSVTAQDTVWMEDVLSECVFLGTYTDPDNAKELLREKLKRRAAGIFNSELITSTTITTNSVVTYDEIRSAVQGLVRLDANQEFYNGKSLGEICIQARVFMLDADMWLFEHREIAGERECDTSDRPRQTRIEEVKNRVRSEALVRFDGRLARIEQAQRLELLHEVKYVETGFEQDTGAYCAAFTGYIIPLEVYVLLGVPPPPSPLLASLTPTATPLAPLTIISVSPQSPVPAGTIVTIRGTGPAAAQIEVSSNGAPLGTTFTDVRGAWEFDAPFNTPGYYRLATRMYLANGRVRPGSGDVFIRVAAPTPTPSPTPAPTDTPVPTATDTPRPAPTSTKTPTSVPTVVLLPPTSTPRLSAVRPTPTPAPSPTPVPAAAGRLTLRSPGNGDSLSGTREFQWEYSTGLAANQQFELVFWPVTNGAEPTGWCAPRGPLPATVVAVDLDAFAEQHAACLKPGESYFWGVYLVSADDPRTYLGGGWSFTYQRGGGEPNPSSGGQPGGGSSDPLPPGVP